MRVEVQAALFTGIRGRNSAVTDLGPQDVADLLVCFLTTKALYLDDKLALDVRSLMSDL